LFARIREFVTAGLWVIVNGWWIQPDCNVPSGEAIIRQPLYGKRYFAHRFGVDVTVGYNVDSFGHTATLPMLLQHTESDSYVFMRPQAHEMALPGGVVRLGHAGWLARAHLSYPERLSQRDAGGTVA
jgi:alpha-mannosidase